LVCEVRVDQPITRSLLLREGVENAGGMALQGTPHDSCASRGPGSGMLSHKNLKVGQDDLTSEIANTYHSNAVMC
jgi:hypothetical protein